MKKLSRSFSNAFRGINHAFIEERNFRIHIILSLVAVIFGILFNITKAEWLAITIVIGLGLAIELVNTAIENTLDISYKGHNGIIRKIKDMMAGAVLVVALVALTVAAIIFIPYIMS